MPNAVTDPISQFRSSETYTAICSIESLYSAWKKVRANRGVGGIDSVSLKDFERNLQANLTELSRNLMSGSYRPLPVRYVKVMKANGKVRELGILTVRDRVTQRAVLDAVEVVFEAEMQDCSYAFRTGRNVEMAIQQVLVSRANGLSWTVESDIQDFFPSIDKDILVREIGRIIHDERVQDLIRLWLDAGMLEEGWLQRSGRKLADVTTIIEQIFTDRLDEIAAQRQSIYPGLADLSTDLGTEPSGSSFDLDATTRSFRRDAAKELVKDGLWLAYSHRATLIKLLGAKLLGVGGLAAAGIMLTPKILETYRRFYHPTKGILQGAPLSPVLANYYLTEFDRGFQTDDLQMVRYCDDFAVLCKSEADATIALARARQILRGLGLQLHPEKTRIVPPGVEFSFLGYRFLANGLMETPPTLAADAARKMMTLAKRAAAVLQRRPGRGTPQQDIR